MLTTYAQALLAERARTPPAAPIIEGGMIDVSVTARSVGTMRRTLATRALLAALKPQWNAGAEVQELNLRVLLRVAGEAIRAVIVTKQNGAPFAAFIEDGRNRLGQTQHRELRAYVTLDRRRGHAVVDLARKEHAL